jgi:histidyl-tRNA synthetase
MGESDDSLILGPPRGMRDFYPADMARRNAIFDAWTVASQAYGFDPYDACVVESLDLLKRKAGEEIVEQIYAFQDKSGRDLALRAEMTPTLARMIVARQGQLSFPLKWFTIAQCFRYERASKGRKREHYQWNLDIVGEGSVMAEAEVLGAAVHALSRLGLGRDDFRVHVSSRAVLADLLEKSGVSRPHHPATFVALDKRGKLDESEIVAQLTAAGLDGPSIDSVFGVLRIGTLEQAAAALGGATESCRRLRDLFEVAAGYGIADLLKFDISIIRGLGYYTGIVFEAFDVDRKLRAIFGGGRYDNLLSDLGGRAASAVGLGFGDVVIGELMAERGKEPSPSSGARIAIGYMEEGQRAVAVSLARALRAAGNNVDLGLHTEKAKGFFSRVGKPGFREAVYVGPDDVQRGTVRRKDLASRTESELPIVSITDESPGPGV